MGRSDVKSPVVSGEIVAGKYRVEETLGSGGMGIVVAAVHIDIGQAVALKFVLSESLTSTDGDDAVERFMREARATAQLKNEHVTRIYDMGRLESGEPFLVMERLEGRDLSRLAKETKVSVAEAVEYVLQACEALIEAHAFGIIHRDLKPHNLFVTRRMNGSPLVKVLDFGISRATGTAALGQKALTSSGVVLGSPLYMAPEQMRAARNADSRSDIWSLGVILYELIGGRVPFDGESMTELCLKVTGEAPASLRDVRGDIDPELAAIIHRCLEKSPEKRYANVASLAAALDPFSTSGKRGLVDRPWTSLVDTANSAPFNPPPIPASADLRDLEMSASGTRTNWKQTSGGTRTALGRTSSIGAALAVLAIVVGGIVFFASNRHESALTTKPSALPATASMAPVVTAAADHTPQPAPLPTTSIVNTTPPATPAPRATTAIPLHPIAALRPKAAPSASAVPTVVAQDPPARPLTNGAPILR